MQGYSLRELHYFILSCHFFPTEKENLHGANCIVHRKPDLLSIPNSRALRWDFSRRVAFLC